MEKGQKILTSWNRTYMMVGRWDRDIVLAPVDDKDDQVMVYTASEIAEEIKSGKFQIVK